jgi:Fe-S cluster assembly protein SufD
VAAAGFADASLPTTEEEVWRYSRIDDLDLDDFRPATGGSAPGASAPEADVPERLRPLLDATQERAALVVARNGRIVQAEVRDDLAAKGVRAERIGEADADVLGAAVDRAPDVFLGFNDAFLAEPVVVRVPPGVAVDAPSWWRI